MKSKSKQHRHTRNLLLFNEWAIWIVTIKMDTKYENTQNIKLSNDKTNATKKQNKFNEKK